MITVDGTSSAEAYDAFAAAADDAPSAGRRRGTVALWSWALTLAVATALRHLSGTFLDRGIVNADTLGVPAVLDAVRMDGLTALVDWHWPAAPYFLFDFVLYLPIWLAAPDPWLAPALFLVAQLLLLQFAIVAVCRLVEPRWWIVSSVVGFTMLIGLANLSILPAYYLLVSSFHTSAFIATLLMVRWFVLSGESVATGLGPQRPTTIVGIGIVVALLVLSDPLFLVSTVVPLVVVGLAARLQMVQSRGDLVRWRASGRSMLSMVVGSVVGLQGNSAMASSDTPYGPQLAGSGPIGRLRELASALAAIDPRLSVVIVTSIVVAVVAIGVSHSGEWGRLALVGAFWGVGAASQVSALVLTDGSLALRYLLVALLLPVVLVGPAVVRIGRELTGVAHGPPRWMAMAMVSGVGLLAVPVVLVPALSNLSSVRLTSRPDLVRCVDEVIGPDHQAMIGLADYWSARRLQVFASSDTRVVGMDWHGRPLRMNTSSEWLSQPYDYLVVEANASGWSPPTDQFHASGLVEAAATCGAYEIIRFAEPGLRLPLLDGSGDAVTFDGCLLRTKTGQVDEDLCEIQVDGAAADTFGSFGGYLLVSPGRYRAVIEYSSPGPTTAEVAVAEITRKGRALDELEVVTTSVLSGTNGVPRTVTIDFEIGPEHSANGAVIEARTIVRGDYSIGSVAFLRDE